jgi:TPR repeat protein
VEGDKNGSNYSANSMGLAYARGWGVPVNYGEALRWYQKAAGEGNEMAKKNAAELNAYLASHRQ